MRGKVPAAVKLNFPVGITPAYAGKRYLQANLPLANQDHPRLCGEKGTSPRCRFCFYGITPAYAGKSD